VKRIIDKWVVDTAELARPKRRSEGDVQRGSVCLATARVRRLESQLMNFELAPIDDGLREALGDASRTADAVGRIAATMVSAGSASVLMSASPGARLAISKVTVLIGGDRETMRPFVRAVPRPLSQSVIDELDADELPHKVVVNVDVLDADDSTIATGSIEYTVEVSSSERR
jgi:hypothetical protein